MHISLSVDIRLIAKLVLFQPTEVDVLEKLPFLFENLRFLSVTVNFCKVCHIFSMFCLLRIAPVLKELEVWVMLISHLQFSL